MGDEKTASGEIRSLTWWRTSIGQDQIDHLEDLAKEARDTGMDTAAHPYRYMRIAVDEWIQAEYRRRVEREEQERNARAVAITSQIEELAAQIKALRAQLEGEPGRGRDHAPSTTAPIIEPHQQPLPLPRKRTRPPGSIRQHATRDVIAALKGRGWTYEAEIARMVYGSPGRRNEARTRKRLRALELAGVVEARKTESAEGHGFPWRLKREVVDG